LADILNVTETQARVLRAIAYYEIKSNQKGATQYTCSRKIPKKYQVSDSTFHDNIKTLQENLMVIELKKNGKSRPNTITDIGQIAWLRVFPIKENLEIIQKIFPNILIYDIDTIINQSTNRDIRMIEDRYCEIVFKIALDSFHINHDISSDKPFYRPLVEETIDLSSDNDYIKTSFTRNITIISSSILSDIKQYYKERGINAILTKNYDELEISIGDRVIFLFYYNLIQSLRNTAYTKHIISKCIPSKQRVKYEKNIEKITNRRLPLQYEIIRKRRKIMKTITSNEIIYKIIEKNLEQLKRYVNADFQEISDIFIKK